MAQQIVYCDVCGRMILPSEISRGDSLVTAGTSVCRACLDAMPPEKRAALQRPAEPTRKPSPPRGGQRAPTPRPGAIARADGAAHGAAAGGAPNRILAVVGATAGTLVGVAATLLVVARTAPTQVASPPAPPAAHVAPAMPVTIAVPVPVPETGSAPPGPAAERLAVARAMIDPSLARYDEARAALAAIAADFPGTQEERDARAALADLDAGLASIADAALEAATRQAAAPTDDGTLTEVEAALRSVESRFRDTEWHRTRGREAIEVARSTLAAARAARIDAAIAKAREALARADEPAMRAALSNERSWPAEARERAAAVTAEFARAQERRAAERRADEAWRAFAAGFVQAGRDGAAAATEYVRRGRAAPDLAGAAERIDRLESLARDALLVESLA